MIYILDRSEKIVGFLQNRTDKMVKNIYFEDLLTEDLATGSETYAISSLCEDNTAKYLEVGNYIAFKKNNYYKLLQIIETDEEKEEVLVKKIYCETAGMELLGNVYRGGTLNNVNIRRFLENVLQDTHWKVGKVDENLTTTLALELEEKEVYSLIQENISKFNAEIEFRVDIKGNRIVGRYIDVYSARGKYTGKRLEITKDINKISRKIDIFSYATKLIGVGKDGLSFKDIQAADKPLGQNFIVNQKAYERLNNKGSHITRIFEYDTTDANELLLQTRKALEQMSQPQVTYEIDCNIVDIDVEVGDTLIVSDMSFNPPLTIATRVGKLETSRADKTLNKATLTNFKEIKSGITKYSIGTNDILDGAITQDKIDDMYTQTITTDILEATKIYTDNLFVDVAKIKDLEAINATIENLTVKDAEIENAVVENLQATNAKIESLKADYAEIDQLIANKAEIKDLEVINANINALRADKADITQLNAISANINHLQANVAEIDTLLAGNITSENIASGTITAEDIQTGTITAGSGVIAEGAIGNAQISSVDAGKINAGTVDTSRVTIQGANGHLKIKGNRLQVFNGTGSLAKERVSLGDVNGNGSVYGLRVRGADGTTILLDENGVTSEGITDGSISNEKINDDANIDGSKLNINSVVSKINEDGTEVIKGTKIEVDGTSLTTKLSTITTKQTEQSEKITKNSASIKANENAIKLKVDNQTYQTDKSNMTSTLNKHTSEISTMKDEISLKVEQTDIEQALKELEIGSVNYALGTINPKTFNFTNIANQNIACYEVLEETSGQDVVISFDYEFIDLEGIENGDIYFQAMSFKEDGTNKWYVPKVNCFEGLLKEGNSSGHISFKAKFPEFKKGTSLTFRFRADYLMGQFSIKNAQVELGNVESNWKPNFKDIENKIDTSINQAKAEIKVTTDSIFQNISNLTNEVYEKADGSIVTTLSNKVGTLETSVNGISGKVSNLETTTTTLNSNITKAQNTANTANSTANSNKTNISNLQGEIRTVKSDVAELEVTTSGISQKVSNTESNITTINDKITNHETRIKTAESKITTDAIINTVSSTIDTKVNNGINSLNIGGRNFLENSSFASNLDKWETTGNSYISFVTVDDKKCCKINSTEFQKTIYPYQSILKDLIPGETYTVSGWVKTENMVKGTTNFACMLYISGYYDNSGTSTWFTLGQKQFTVNTGKGTWEHVKWTFTATKDTVSKATQLNFFVHTRDFKGQIYFRDIQLEKGNKATDWSPSPEDIESKVDSQYSELKQTASEITSTVSDLNGKYTQIKQTIDGIDLTGKVSFSDLSTSGKTTIHGANLSTGTVTADKIVAGSITAKQIAAGAITADMITTGTLNASKVNVTNLNASNITTGTLSGDRIKGGTLSATNEINFIGGARIFGNTGAYDAGLTISAQQYNFNSGEAYFEDNLYAKKNFTVTNNIKGASATITGTASIGNISTNGLNVYGSTSLSGALYTSGAATIGSSLSVKNSAIYGMNNLALSRSSLYIPNFSGNVTMDYLRIGAGFVGCTDGGVFHIITNNASRNLQLGSGQSLYLPHSNGYVTTEMVRLGAGIMACPSSGSFHFITASGATTPLYAGTLYSRSVLSVDEPEIINEESVFDKINSINVINTSKGLRLHNPASSIDALEDSMEVIKTSYDKEKGEINTDIDYTSAIATLWKAVQELKKENQELKNIYTGEN